MLSPQLIMVRFTIQLYDGTKAISILRNSHTSCLDISQVSSMKYNTLVSWAVSQRRNHQGKQPVSVLYCVASVFFLDSVVFISTKCPSVFPVEEESNYS